MEIVKSLAPLLAPALLSKLTGQGDNAPQSEQAVPATPAQSAPQPPPPQAAKYQHIIARILYGIENGFAADFIGEEIGMLAEKDATLTQMLNPLISAPVDLIHAQLSQLSPQAARVLALPTAKEWLAELQDYFSEEPEGNAGTTQAQGAVG